jgi:large subunit ribosomal protein L17
MSTALFTHERITTTLMKAKEMRPFAERLITLSKQDTLPARRRVARHVRDKAALKKLFETLAPRFAQRPGGYTRLYHLGHRPGDAADMALVELVTSEVRRAELGARARAVVLSRQGASARNLDLLLPMLDERSCSAPTEDAQCRHQSSSHLLNE